MSSRGPSPGGLRVPRRGKAAAATQYVLLGVVAVIVLLVVLFAVQGKARKPTSEATRGGRRTERAGGALAEEQVGTRSRRPSRRERAAERRTSRARDRRSERSAAGSVSTGRARASRSEASYSTGSRRSSRRSGVPVLNGTDGTSTAVFSTRVVRKGEEIEGRRVVEVGRSSVTIEYRNERYQVKVGEPLYDR